MLDSLNPAQQQAVLHDSSPLLVLAGAGSGKTRVLTEKIAYLIQQRLYNPGSIVAVTFTNKAAKEMKARVAKLLNEETAKAVHISTFHTLGLKLIRENTKRFARKSGFSIYDASDSQSLIKDIMRRDYGDPGNLAERVQWIISNWKQLLHSPEQVAQTAAADPVTITAVQVYKKYEEALAAYNAFDFDDLIVKPVMMLSQDAEYRQQQQILLRHILVDEYQDTNVSQYELVKQLAGTVTPFTVVGDDDQSIYAWRGARPENLAQLKEDYPRLEVITLEQNYRSTGNILSAANHVIANNPHVFEKKLWSQFGPGETITVLSCEDDEREAESVITGLQHHMFSQRSKFSDYAILYRSNHQSRLLEQQLREKNIPYYLSGGISFFALGEIKDVMAYLRIVSNLSDDNALLRIINTPRRELGTTSVQKLVEFAAQQRCSILEAAQMPELEKILTPRAYRNFLEFKHWLENLHQQSEQPSADKLCQKIIHDVQYEQWILDTQADEVQAQRKLKNVNELMQWIERLCNQDLSASLADIVAKLTLIDVLERDKENENESNCVNLMTLHAAKGLEFQHVYLVGMEENILPHRNSIEDGSIEEERRLAYVGITRARKKLTISYAMKRKRYGQCDDTEPSRFIKEIPAQLIQRRGVESDLTGEERIEHGQQQLAGLRSLLLEQ